MIRKTIALCALLFAGAVSAQTKISALDALAAAPASGDLVAIVDVSDTTQAATGTTKKITAANLFLFAFSNANTFTAAQTAQITDAGTTTVVYPLIVDHQSSGTPANGQGVGIAFDVETAAGNTERLGSISAVSYDVTAASEDSRIRFNAFYAGAEVVAGHIGPHNSIAGYGNLWLGTTAPSSTNHALTSTAATTAVNATSNVYVGVSGTNYQVFGNAYLYTISTGQFGWTSSGTIGTTADTGLARNAAGVIRASAGASEIRGFLGGGAAVASAAALPVPTGRVFHVTGTTGITSITSTNFGSGACVTMIFDAALTVTDGSNLKLAGDFTTTADDTLSVCYDGTSWFETGRSVN